MRTPTSTHARSLPHAAIIAVVAIAAIVIAPGVLAATGITVAAGAPPSVTFTQLGTPLAGNERYCTNCNPNTSPCTSGGAGAFADRVGSAWVCRPITTSGGGTVTSVGNGTIAAIFTSTWATATTTPAQSLSFTAQLANCILAGPTSGGNAAPTCRAMVLADLPASIPLSGLATQNANTVVANVTAGSATPTAFAMPSCSTSASALIWTTSTGFGCNTGIAASTVTYPLAGTPTAPTAAVDTNSTQVATTAYVIAQAASANPVINGTAAPGTSTRYARADHVHPTDTTRIATSGNQSINGNLRTGSSSAPGTVLHAGIGDTSSTAAEVRVDSGSSVNGYAAFGMSRNGVNQAYMAVVAATDQFIPGAANNDLIIRGQKLLISADNGTTKHAVFASTGSSFIGTTTNDSAATGFIGEYITGTVAANTTSMSTGTSVNVGANTNITLTAGDWDCTGVVNFTFGATTSITNLTGGVSTTTGTLPAQDSYFDYETSAMIPTGTAVATWNVPTVRLLNSGSTNVFLVTQATFTASTLKAGGTIRCRRMR